MQTQERTQAYDATVLDLGFRQGNQGPGGCKTNRFDPDRCGRPAGREGGHAKGNDSTMTRLLKFQDKLFTSGVGSG